MSQFKTGHEKLYNIVRFYSKEGKPSKIVKRGVTLKEAQEHCQRDDTRKAGVWFDGYNAQ